MANNLPHVFNLSNSIIGVTILAMPYCYKECGIILGTLLLIFCTWLTLVSCRLLMKAGITSRRRSYGFLAYYTYGAPGKLAVEIGMIGLQIGTLIAQVVIIGDLGPNIISKYTGLQNTSNLRTAVVMVLCIGVGLPLCLLKNLATLSRASTMCILFYTFFVLYVISLSLPNLLEGSWINKVWLWRHDGMLKCLPIFSFAYGCQTQLFILYDALPEPSFKGINSVVSFAVNLCTVAYVLVGFFGYVTFCDRDIGGDVITEFQVSLVSDILQLGFVTTIAVTFPLVIYPCRVSLYTLLFPQKKKHVEDFEQRPIIPDFHFKILTAFIVVGAMITGILVPNVEFVLQMNGATMGTLICYIFPAVFFLRVMAGSSDGKNMAQAVFVFGFLIMVLCTYTALSIEGHDTKPMEKAVEDIKVRNAAADGLREKPLQPPVDIQNSIKDVDPAKNKPPDLIDKQSDDKRIEPPNPREPAEGNGSQKEAEISKKDSNDGKGIDPKVEKAADAGSSKDEKLKTAVKTEAGVDTQIQKSADSGKKENQGEVKEKLKEEKKPEELIAQLEKQQIEQKELIQEQKKILEELKEHQLEHNQIIHAKNSDQNKQIVNKQEQNGNADINQNIPQQPAINQQQPAVNQQQVANQQPAVNQQQPVANQQPAVNQQQVANKQSVVNQQQVANQQPVVNQQQVANQQPAVNQQQVANQQPAVNQQQPAVNKQQVVNPPVVNQQPAVNQQQVANQQQPVVNQQQVAHQQQPAVNQQQVANQQQPAVNQQQVANQQQPVVNQQQVENQQQPAVKQQLVANQQLGANQQSVGNQQPAANQESVGKQQVVANQQPFAKQQPKQVADGDGVNDFLKNINQPEIVHQDSGSQQKNIVVNKNNQPLVKSDKNSVKVNQQVGQDSVVTQNILHGKTEASQPKSKDLPKKQEIRKRRDVSSNNNNQNIGMSDFDNADRHNDEMRRKKLLSLKENDKDFKNILDQLETKSLLVDPLPQLRSLKHLQRKNT